MSTSGFFLVTGASAGIGRELARVIGTHGHDLILVARRVDRLEELATELRDAHGITVHVLGADLADPDTPEELYGWTEGAGLRVDALVNNAGFGAYGDFVEIDRERQLEMTRVNMTALADLTHRFLPGMLERGLGRILNVASVAAFMPSPVMAIYFATKSFVLSFTEALSGELRGTGVTATALCPGPVPTEFSEVAGVSASRFPPGVSAPRVARAGYRGMMKGKVIVMPGFVNRLLVQSVRFTPRALMRWFMLRGQRALLRGK